MEATGAPVFAALQMVADGTVRLIDGLQEGLQAPESGLLWAHLDYADPWIRQWVLEHSGIDATIGEALLAEETRPRCVPHHNGLMIILRGVNLNPRSDPEDMVSIRLWIEKGRAMAIQELREATERGGQTPGYGRVPGAPVRCRDGENGPGDGGPGQRG